MRIGTISQYSVLYTIKHKNNRSFLRISEEILIISISKDRLACGHFMYKTNIIEKTQYKSILNKDLKLEHMF